MKEMVSILCFSVALTCPSLGQGAKVVYRTDLDERIETRVWSSIKTVRTPATGSILLGQYGFRDTTRLMLADLPDHRFLRLRAKLHMIRTVDGSRKSGGPDFWTATVRGSGPLLITTFHNSQGGAPAEERVQAWPDEFPFGEHPPTTGAVATNKLGFESGFLEGRPFIDATYDLVLSFPHRGADVDIELGSAFNGRTSDESWALSDVVVEALPQAKPPDGAAMETLWSDLSGEDPVLANKAVWALVELGDTGVQLVQKKLGAVTREVRAKFEAVLVRLSSEVFVERQKAQKQMFDLASEYRPLIIGKLESGGLDPEVRLALIKALGKAHRSVFASRIDQLMRVSAFEPGLARDAREKNRRLAISTPQKDGSYRMEVRHAEISSEAAWPRFRESFDYLQDVETPGIGLKWQLSAPKPGRYTVLLDYGCGRRSKSASVRVAVGETKIDHQIEPTGSWRTFGEYEVGEVEVKAGQESLEVNFVTLPPDTAGYFNPRAAILAPIKE